MKKYIFSLAILVLCIQVSANTFYQQLCEFNYNWKKYEHQAPAGKARVFKSEKEYIQAHLTCVLDILRSNPIAHLDVNQVQSRTRMIQLLTDYCNHGIFPKNYYRNERIPVFIDEHQTFCAVGYLMKQTGHEDLARRISDSDNYVWVKDIHDAEVPAWQEASGLSVEELKLIQGAYDNYMENAFFLPNRYEIPQKPDCISAYFTNPITGQEMAHKSENIWCYGEGKDGILNGRWEQNYAVGKPWIVGFYENGKRTGQWEEYYQDSKQLCRTENWRNDKLNGVRKRFDRTGELIEEILFKDGKAIRKTNYDLQGSLIWVRTPLDSSLVWTEVYTSGGGLLATGHEKIYNPGNLLWFQNIELTALNSAAISANPAPVFQDFGLLQNPQFGRTRKMANLYNTPPLVQYKKEGTWTYYQEYNPLAANLQSEPLFTEMLQKHFYHFGNEIASAIESFEPPTVSGICDSISIVYSNNYLHHLYALGRNDDLHLYIRYYETNTTPEIFPINYNQGFYGSATVTEIPLLKRELGQYTKENFKIGVWKHFDQHGTLFKTEDFITPWKDEDENLMGMRQ